MGATHLPEMTISYDEISRYDPDVMLPPEAEFLSEYTVACELGRRAAEESSVAFVAICRNAMPFLPLTLVRVETLSRLFGESKTFIYENDSTDDTKEFLSEWQDGVKKIAELNNFDRPHLCGTKLPSRTVALAEYRSRCQEWVESQSTDFVIVFDTDPWGGFSVDGVMNSIGHMTSSCPAASCMASYSWCQWGPPVASRVGNYHYDGWACRWNYWRERHDMAWFHSWHPPVGSPPVRMNSAFGQLAVYRTHNYLRGVYLGEEDCEHVSFHKSIGGDLYLNPSSRCVSFWIPEGVRSQCGRTEGDRLCEDVHEDVAGGDANQNNSSNA